jgi:DNA replication protein DnaC
MRSVDEVEEYKAKAYDEIVLGCKLCHGANPDCSCGVAFNVSISAVEASIPQNFFHVHTKYVRMNENAFNGTVAPYVAKLRKARLKGYSIVFTGDNGVGKTMQTCYILLEAIKKGFTAYYTTLPQLDHDIKLGWRNKAIEERLEWLLTSDFLAIDELGKEKYKAPAGSSDYINTQIERILKSRCDNCMPVILATNLTVNEMGEVYGQSVKSMISGRFHVCSLKPGDYRKTLQKEMRRDMGYGK